MKSIPKSLIPFFQEYDFDEMGLESHKIVIIGRVLEFGTTRELEWLFKTYKQEDVKNFIKEYGYRKLTARSFNFWRIVLGIKKYRKPPWFKKESNPLPGGV